MESFIATVSLQLEISSVRLLEFLLTNLPAPLSRMCCHATFLLSQIYCERTVWTRKQLLMPALTFSSLFGTTGFNDFESVNKDKTWKRQQLTWISPWYHQDVIPTSTHHPATFLPPNCVSSSTSILLVNSVSGWNLPLT